MEGSTTSPGTPAPNGRLFDLLEAVVASVAPDGSLEWAGCATAGILGRPADALLGQPFVELFHGEDRERVEDAVARLQAGEHAVSFNARCPDADGSLRCLSWSLARDPDRGGLCAVGQPILEPANAVDRSQIDHSQIDCPQMAVEASPSALMMVDRDGTIRAANRALEELFGYGRNELLDQSVEILVPTALRSGHVRLRNGYLAAPETLSLGPARSLSGQRKDGSRVAVEIRLNPIRSTDSCFILASVLEITRRQELERERDRIFDLTKELICINGPDGFLLRVNPAVVKTLGFSEQELTSRPFLDFVHPDDRVATRERFEKRLAGGDEGSSEVRCLCKDGSHRVVLWNATYDPEHRRIYAVGHDITDRKREEQELRRATYAAEAMNKELEAFSYSVSHDLRSPLRAIDGFSLALLEDYGDRLDATGRQHIERVRKAAQRMSVLIDDLLNLSRISRHDFTPDRIDLSAIVAKRVAELRQQAPERRVEVRIEPDLMAWGDAGLLEVALHNLLENAWKYTSKRDAARIEFGRAFIDDTPAFFVRDDGVGFDMAYADRLFSAFQRLHRAEEFEGTGIGLATVQRVVNLHGGRLWADAAVDQGAAFYFTLDEARRP